MPSVNFYSHLPSKYKTKTHNPQFGKTHQIKLPFRMGIIGASGTGKSNALLNLLHRMSGTFDRMILVCKAIHGDPLYEMLVDKLGDSITVYENGEVPELNSIASDVLHSKSQILAVFDDVLGDKEANEAIAEYAKRGRKQGISMCYLAQSWYGIPKFIRQQFSHVVIKKVNSSRDLKKILVEFPMAIDFETLKQMYDFATHAFESTMMLDLLSGTVYKDFNELLSPTR